jgi:hypothetical protein
MKNQQMRQLFIQFINYYDISYTFRHYITILEGEFLVPSERCSTAEQSIEYPQYSIDCSSIEHLSEGTRNAP